MKIFPICFSIPSEKIVTNVPEKTKLLATVIPGRLETYIFTNEEDYYQDYRDSIFAITTKKGGWDCMRHYEILANGCIPVFSNIEQCPPNTMTFLPKELIIDANKLYEESIYKPISEIDYYSLSSKLLEYTKTYLTTDCIAKYILEQSGNKDAKTILYLSGDVNPDYLRCITLHGFKKLFGKNCHDYPKIEHIYKTGNVRSYLYGRGFTYTNVVNPDDRNNDLDQTIVDDIVNKKYDVIIYGSFHRGMPYYDLVSSTYDPNKIILMCGEDLHTCSYNQFKNHPIFVREL